MDGLPTAGITAAMQLRRPQCLLWTQSFRTPAAAYEEAIRCLAPTTFGWRFALETADPQSQCEGEEDEASHSLERAALLAVVRGLEAIDQPSSVILYSSSRFVMAGLRHGLAEWRSTNWHWEWYGKWAPVAHQDLWRRVERALKFHDVEPRWWSASDADSTIHAGPPSSMQRGTRRVIRLDREEPLPEPQTAKRRKTELSRESRDKVRTALALIADPPTTLFPRYEGFDF